MHSANPNPSELLRRYRRNIYPPSLSETNQEVVKDYLEERGLGPKIGAVAIEPNLTTKSLVKLAIAELDLLPRGTSVEDVVVGPHSLGMPNAISLWMPATLPNNKGV
jgi:hypothetical protein